jgi:hypothetical protein
MAEFIDRVTSYGNLSTNYNDDGKPSKPDNKVDNSRKIICRYGRGCTHLNDATHRDQFWHPPVSWINGENFNF